MGEILGDNLMCRIVTSHGAVYEAPGPGTERGFGWEYIRRTPGIHDQEDIGEVLRAPDAVTYHDGEATLIIGDDSEGDIVGISLVSGVVLTATSYEETYEEELIEDDREVVLPSNSWDKIRNKHGDEVSKEIIREAIENPDSVYRNDEGLYMWIIEIGGQIYLVRGYYLESEGVIEIGTAYETTIREVEEYRDRFQMDRIYPE